MDRSEFQHLVYSSGIGSMNVSPVAPPCLYGPFTVDRLVLRCADEGVHTPVSRKLA
jgi:hypothetical protein